MERRIDELFLAAVAGDDDAWTEMVERLSPAIWAVVRSFNLDRAEAEDLAQTVWLRLVDRHGEVRDPAAIPGWIKTTARNEAISMMRRTGRDGGSVDDLYEEPVSEQPTPSDIVESDDANQLLVGGLCELDEKCQQLLRLLAHKVPYRDVSDLMEMPVGSIGPTRDRCLEKLRRTAPVRRLVAGEPGAPR